MTKKGNGAFAGALQAPGLHREIRQEQDLYGRLIGSWALTVLYYRSNVADLKIKGEAHFERVLEGRAVQDVWIMPQRTDRGASLRQDLNMYGTTLRVWDPASECWRVTWVNAVTGLRSELIGRSVAGDIVQVGTHGNGTAIRWNFVEITRDSFHWTGEALSADAKSWILEGEFEAMRIR